MDGETEKKVVVAKNAAELQKIRLEKLMKNPDKPVHIPDHSKDYKPRDPLEFIRNVWGSSAGAGSGDFHVYRGVRRREYARQKFNNEKNEREEKNDAYQQKVEQNAIEAEARTAKKRAKRMKKKQKQKNKKPKKEEKSESEEDSEEDSCVDEKEKRDATTTDRDNGEPTECTSTSGARGEQRHSGEGKLQGTDSDTDKQAGVGQVEKDGVSGNSDSSESSR